MKKPLFAIHSIPVSRRMFYSFLLMSIAPIIVFAIIAYWVAGNAVINQSGEYSLQVMKTLSKNISFEAQKYEDAADDVLVSASVIPYLENRSDWNYTEQSDFISQVSDALKNMRHSTPEIRQFYILDSERKSVYSLGGFVITDECIHKAVQGLTQQKPVNWLSLNTAGSNFVVYVQPVISERQSSIIGYMLVFIDPGPFEKCLQETNMGSGSELFLKDARGNLIASRNREYSLGMPLSSELATPEYGNSLKRSMYFHQTRCMLASSSLKSQNWTIISTIPYSYLRRGTLGIMFGLGGLMCLCLLCAVIVYHFIWTSVVNDENKLAARVANEERQKREFELKMLQAQINPHFLFNTLNSLRWTALMSQADNVAGGLSALSGLLKNTIINKDEFISIQDELKNIEDYATIQRLRYGAAFSIMYDVPDDLKSLYVLKFLFQPIVENSIIHGADNPTSKITIVISIIQISDRLRIVIRDNGRGFDPKKLKQAAHGRMSGIGIENIEQRIKLCFGESSNFSLESKVNEGTSVTMEIPIIKNLKKNINESETEND